MLMHCYEEYVFLLSGLRIRKIEKRENESPQKGPTICIEINFQYYNSKRADGFGVIKISR